MCLGGSKVESWKWGWKIIQINLRWEKLEFAKRRWTFISRRSKILLISWSPWNVYQIPWLFQILDKIIKSPDLFGKFLNSSTFSGSAGSIATLLQEPEKKKKFNKSQEPEEKSFTKVKILLHFSFSFSNAVHFLIWPEIEKLLFFKYFF